MQDLQGKTTVASMAAAGGAAAAAESSVVQEKAVPATKAAVPVQATAGTGGNKGKEVPRISYVTVSELERVPRSVVLRGLLLRL